MLLQLLLPILKLGVTGKQIEVATHWGVFPDIFNVEDSTFSFLENVLDRSNGYFSRGSTYILVVMKL